jgi:hypothetical protein
MLTVCIAAPRPAPMIIWYPTHFPTLVVGESVDMRPLPMVVTMLPPKAHGR